MQIKEDNSIGFDNYYMRGVELLYFPNETNHSIVEVVSSGFEKFNCPDVIKFDETIWVPANKNNNLRRISQTFYGGKLSPESIAKYNNLLCSADECLPFGVPILLVKQGLIKNIGYVVGGIPFYAILNVKESEEEFVDKTYGPIGEKRRIMLEELKRYNTFIGSQYFEFFNYSASAKLVGKDEYCLYLPKFWPITKRTIMPTITGD
ncbi:MAG: hypothetical protein WC758_01035 [Candidatus Woesearchaeota archaeon]